MVTGAAGGIGLAVAEAFAARGDTVTGVDARGAELRVPRWPAIGATRLVADLGDERCAEVIEQAARLAGPVDVLVNAAGHLPGDPARRHDRGRAGTACSRSTCARPCC